MPTIKAWGVGTRPLATVFETADETAKQLLAKKPPAYQLVEGVDELFRVRLFCDDVSIHPLAALLALNSYYSFIGAARVAISGQVTAVFPVSRHCLECACYSYLISRDERKARIWAERTKGEEQLRICRKEFGSAVADASKMVHDVNADLSSLVADLYQASIEFGGHPNALSIVQNIDIASTDDGNIAVSLNCLYGEGDIKVQQALLACAEFGAAAVFLIALSCERHPLIDDGLSALVEFYGSANRLIAELGKAS